MKRNIRKVMRRSGAILLALLLFISSQSMPLVLATEVESIKVEVENIKVEVESNKTEATEVVVLESESSISERAELVALGDGSGGNVRLQEASELFETLTEALAEASNLGLKTFTLEVIGPVTETTRPIIDADTNVTIIGAEGEHTVTLVSNTGNILVQNGGSLILGDGTKDNPLTITAPSNAVHITEGTINIKDGIILFGNSSSMGTVELRGENSVGTISGGRVHGYRAAVSAINGALITEISGGEFTGVEAVINSTGSNTRIDLISGGSFIQSDPMVNWEGMALYVQNDATVGKITGGYFETARSSAIIIVRGGWIDEISGGEFTTTGIFGGPTGETRLNSVFIRGDDYPDTGIGLISGGLFHGGYSGVTTLVNYARIDAITGGTFMGVVALQNDQSSVIKEISGGTFVGYNYGILNVNLIEKIGGDVAILGITMAGIFNHPLTGNSRITEISGGLIVSDEGHALLNEGTVSLISGGTFIGELSAIYGVLPRGGFETITGGTFLGKNDVAISLTEPLKLEPGLTEDRGIGRFWGKDGVIFNEVELVHVPEGYHMSTTTVKVVGIDDAEFKFLTLAKNDNGGSNGSGGSGGSGGRPQGQSQDAEEKSNEQGAAVELGILERQAYLIGDADGLIHPHGYITRAEVATIFFRLITDEARENYFLQTNPFSDVETNNWFNNAVSTMTNAGVFTGRPGDIFAPNENITRAELAVAIVKFMEMFSLELDLTSNQVEEIALNGARNINSTANYTVFSDIENHWASVYINIATANGWLRGYPDGNFMPDKPITRAETVAIINRILGRLPKTADDLLPDMITWIDNADINRWYYLHMQAASNSYKSKLKGDGIHERWLTIMPIRDWKALERPDLHL